MEEKPVSAPPIAIGELQVQRIEENCGPFFPPSVLLPDLPPDGLCCRFCG
jgi:hypothetical protein